MKITAVESLKLDDVKVIRFARFRDHRGYFTEHYKKSDFAGHCEMEFLKGAEFVQCNECYSRKGAVRGLHFQWNPYMGKLVRTVSGRMVDMVLDIRKGSPTFGKIICYNMPASQEQDYAEWIWVPPGFAHGFFFPEDSLVEYFCSGGYNAACEAGISPLATDIDWSLCDPELANEFKEIASATELITDKDRNAFSVTAWQADERYGNFIYGQL